MASKASVEQRSVARFLFLTLIEMIESSAARGRVFL
jgi:hypothetical protein